MKQVSVWGVARGFLKHPQEMTATVATLCSQHVETQVCGELSMHAIEYPAD
jgi:intracellular sulfur oxidation DsrE/DsrF family protein